MKEYLSKIKFISLAVSLISIAFGITLICIPTATLSVVCYILGALLLVIGVCKIVDYFTYGIEPFGFVNGLFFFTLGILFICANKTVADPTMIAFLAGIFFILKSILNIQNSIDYRRMGVKTWWIDLVCNIVLFVFGIIIISNPFATEGILYISLGITILLDGLLKLLDIFLITYKINKVKRNFHSFAIEPNVIYVEDENDKK